MDQRPAALSKYSYFTRIALHPLSIMPVWSIEWCVYARFINWVAKGKGTTLKRLAVMFRVVIALRRKRDDIKYIKYVEKLYYNGSPNIINLFNLDNAYHIAQVSIIITSIQFLAFHEH